MGLIESYIEYLGVQKRYSQRTLQLYRSAIEDYCMYRYKEKTERREDVYSLPDSNLVEQMKVMQLRNFVAEGIGSGLSARSVNLQLSALKGFCRYLLSKGLLDTNPADSLARPKEKKRLPQFYGKEILGEY